MNVALRIFHTDSHEKRFRREFNSGIIISRQKQQKFPPSITHESWVLRYHSSEMNSNIFDEWWIIKYFIYGIIIYRNLYSLNILDRVCNNASRKYDTRRDYWTGTIGVDIMEVRAVALDWTCSRWTVCVWERPAVDEVLADPLRELMWALLHRRFDLAQMQLFVASVEGNVRRPRLQHS